MSIIMMVLNCKKNGKSYFQQYHTIKAVTFRKKNTVLQKLRSPVNFTVHYWHQTCRIFTLNVAVNIA